MTSGDLADTTIGGFLDSLAARAPAPGGGATAALHAAQAAALISMVARYTSGPAYADDADLVSRILEDAEADRAVALALADADADAFTAVTEAYALPRGTDDEQARRSEAIADALVGAAGPPADVIRTAVALVALAEALLPVANRNVVTDVAAATEAARAAATTARLNVEINLGGIRDEKVRTELVGIADRVPEVVDRAAAVELRVRALLR
ncbi:cyclodeaminase/cyclohydrolase family protein [Pseudonocardia alni]|uniref:Formiminotetrahydrofolate cyclodeaminase n=3 Tax=Pseudonocardia TaxID=1847 RepID=A0A852W6D5_PSEA5|nr:cyclodeaminase/cyclohydrolase family protein [Pseudonocardia antarctica]NYG01506.1 formiminotetrahydrofolate cyclodeaminase [Pseudonocardia antarctica]OJG06788.1 Methenyltetrahydrofolate cyclohydrolase [Pseudonocardia autotrophica]